MANFQQQNFNPRRHSKFFPMNPKKFMGNEFCICRSSYEVKFCNWLDQNSKVLKWGSENIRIPYFDPVANKKRTYYPDFFFILANTKGLQDKYIIEIKPSKETRPTKAKKLQNRINENSTFRTNKAKWTAALNFCKKYGLKFKILTEKELFRKC